MMEKIVVDPKIHFGKPRVAGTRITVQSVLELIEEGLSFSRITQDYYPQLTPEDIQVCIRYSVALIAAEEIHLQEVSL